MTPNIIVTSGDPLGIGPQVCVEAINALDEDSANGITFICEDSVLSYLKSMGVSLKYKIEVVSPQVITEFAPGNCDEDICAKSALTAIEMACDMAQGLSGGRAIVTGPVSKERISSFGVEFPGHTEFLQKRFSAPWVEMLFSSGDLNVLLATRHIPLKDVPDAITKERIAFLIDVMDGFLAKTGNRGEIAVCGLNPHAGENGMLGKEEQLVISPVIESARSAGLRVNGPFPADTLFWRQNLKKYAGVIAMYHDQGLIPVKVLAFDSAVNITLGLPVVRTSPVHGTAYSIAYKEAPDYLPMLSAIKKAMELV